MPVLLDEAEWLLPHYQQSRISAVRRDNVFFQPMCEAVQCRVQSEIGSYLEQVQRYLRLPQLAPPELAVDTLFHGSNFNLKEFNIERDLDLLIHLRSCQWLAADRDSVVGMITHLKNSLKESSEIEMPQLGDGSLRLKLTVVEKEPNTVLGLRGVVERYTSTRTNQAGEKEEEFNTERIYPVTTKKSLEFDISVVPDLKPVICIEYGYELLGQVALNSKRTREGVERPFQQRFATLLDVYKYLKQYLVPVFKELLRSKGHFYWSSHWLAYVMIWITLWKKNWIYFPGYSFDRDTYLQFANLPAMWSYGLELNHKTFPFLEFDYSALNHLSMQEVVEAVVEELKLTLNEMADSYSGHAFELHDPFNRCGAKPKSIQQDGSLDEVAVEAFKTELKKEVNTKALQVVAKLKEEIQKVWTSDPIVDRSGVPPKRNRVRGVGR